MWRPSGLSAMFLAACLGAILCSSVASAEFDFPAANLRSIQRHLVRMGEFFPVNRYVRQGSPPVFVDYLLFPVLVKVTRASMELAPRTLKEAPSRSLPSPTCPLSLEPSTCFLLSASFFV